MEDDTQEVTAQKYDTYELEGLEKLDYPYLLYNFVVVNIRIGGHVWIEEYVL